MYQKGWAVNVRLCDIADRKSDKMFESLFASNTWIDKSGILYAVFHRTPTKHTAIYSSTTLRNVEKDLDRI